MTEKIFGYVLIIVGILAILYSSMSVYDVFTKKASPANLFSFPGISLDPAQLIAGANLPQGVTLPTSAKMEIMTPDMINTTSNIFAHVVLMGFLASAGLKLATIGTQLVRAINVKVKAKEDTITS
jgi:hypothetical protein